MVKWIPYRIFKNMSASAKATQIKRFYANGNKQTFVNKNRSVSTKPKSNRNPDGSPMYYYPMGWKRIPENAYRSKSWAEYRDHEMSD